MASPELIKENGVGILYLNSPYLLALCLGILFFFLIQPFNLCVYALVFT